MQLGTGIGNLTTFLFGSPLSNCYRHRSATHRFSSAASAGNASTLHGMRVATGAIYKTTSEGAVGCGSIVERP